MQYWNAVARFELIRIATEYRNSVASLVKTIRERVEVGLADPQDLLMAEVKLNEAQYQVLQAQSNFDTGRMALNSLIGVELKAETQIEDTVPNISLSEDLLLTDGSNRPEIRIAHDQIRIAESTGKLTDSKYKPQLYIGADGTYSSRVIISKVISIPTMPFMPSYLFLFSNGGNAVMRNVLLPGK